MTSGNFMHRCNSLLEGVWRFAKCLVPATCIVCGRNTSATFNLCHACTRELPWIRDACSHCGESGLQLHPHYRKCAQCIASPPAFQFCRGLFHYQPPIAQLLGSLKFQAGFEAGYALSSLLALAMKQYYEEAPKPELIVPIPLHRNRLRVRGYNQAVEIAKRISQHCNIPMNCQLLQRQRDTLPQTEIKSARARMQNLKNAFQLKDPALLENVKSIALIDDVVTTTATVTAAANVLGGSGISHIHIWCVARASR